MAEYNPEYPGFTDVCGLAPGPGLAPASSSAPGPCPGLAPAACLGCQQLFPVDSKQYKAAQSTYLTFVKMVLQLDSIEVAAVAKECGLDKLQWCDQCAHDKCTRCFAPIDLLTGYYDLEDDEGFCEKCHGLTAVVPCCNRFAYKCSPCKGCNSCRECVCYVIQ